MRNSKLLFLIPAFNEEENLRVLLNEIKKRFSGYDILVVDDGSTDNTRKIAEEKQVEVISMPFNLGIGGAVQAGLKYASRKKYDCVVRIDGDGQHPVEEIEKVLTELDDEKDVDVVIGSRYNKKNRYKGKKVRKLGTDILSKVVSFITGQKFTDVTSGFYGFKRGALNFLLKNYPEDYPEVESIIKLKKHNFKIKEVPVEMKLRCFGRSSIGNINSIYYMVRVVLGILIFLFKKKQ